MNYSTNAQPALAYDDISARDAFLRDEMQRGSEKLLCAMRRELESMGRLL